MASVDEADQLEIEMAANHCIHWADGGPAFTITCSKHTAQVETFKNGKTCKIQ